MMFNMISGGKDVIQVDQLDPRSKGMIDRFGSMVGLSGNQISRDQFKQAMTKVKEMAASGQLPSGMSFRGPGGGSGASPDGDRRLDEAFKRMDQNEDGVLQYNEMSETLQAERDKYDTNHDGVIDLNEFKAYVSARFSAPRSGDNPGAVPGGAGGPAPAEDEERKRPTILRAGNLPRDFPYASLDRDLDGQIGLYEWKEAGRRIAEFLPMDLNNDGFLTVDEYFRWKKQGDELALKNSSASGEFARGRGRGGPGMGMPGMGDGMMAMNSGRFGPGMGMPGMGSPGMGMADRANWQGMGPRGDRGDRGNGMMGAGMDDRGPRTFTMGGPGAGRDFGSYGMGSPGMGIPGFSGPGGGMGMPNYGGPGSGRTFGGNFPGMGAGAFTPGVMPPGATTGGFAPPGGFTMPAGSGLPGGMMQMPYGNRGDGGAASFGDRGPRGDRGPGSVGDRGDRGQGGRRGGPGGGGGGFGGPGSGGPGGGAPGGDRGPGRGRG
jgi:Ca2+-binding EF-hand superfamily protein